MECRPLALSCPFLLLQGGILVFGSPARLGEKAKQFTLAARVENHPNVVNTAGPAPAAWVQHQRAMQCGHALHAVQGRQLHVVARRVEHLTEVQRCV